MEVVVLLMIFKSRHTWSQRVTCRIYGSQPWGMGKGDNISPGKRSSSSPDFIFNSLRSIQNKIRVKLETRHAQFSVRGLDNLSTSRPPTRIEY